MQWDITELNKMRDEVTSMLLAHPDLDTVFVNAGVQNHYDIFTSHQHQPPPHEVPMIDQSSIIHELTTNLTAPILLAHYFAPHLFTLSQSGIPTTLFLTSSSLAYFPVSFYPIYCPAKAGVASFAKVLRGQLDAAAAAAATGGLNGEGKKGGMMNVVEVVPPYVDTPLNAAHRQATDDLQGGKEKAVQPMPLNEYVEGWFEELERTREDGREGFRNEVGVGFGKMGARVWREGFDKLLTGSGMGD